MRGTKLSISDRDPVSASRALAQVRCLSQHSRGTSHNDEKPDLTGYTRVG